MKNPKVFFLIPLWAALVIFTPRSFCAETLDDGTMTFTYDLEEGQCVIPVTNGAVVNIHHGDTGNQPGAPCKGHSIRYVRFNQVRSAVTVELSSEQDQWGHGIGCNDNPDNFKFVLRTIKSNLTTTDLALDGITAAQVGFPVMPGILLKSRWVSDPNDVNRELTCIKVTYD